MTTLWHLLRLPVRESRTPHPLGFVQGMVFCWPEPEIFGLTLQTRSWTVPFLPAGTFRLTAFGVEIQDRSTIERVSRKWWRERRRMSEEWKRRPVFSQGCLVGYLHDVVIDEERMVLAAGVVSRGVVSDLTHGRAIVPIQSFWEDPEGRMNIC